MGLGRTWSQQDETYLSDNYGTISIKTLAKNLNRSENSILVRRTQKKLGSFLENGEYVSYSQLLMAIYGLDAQNAYRIHKNWEGFPVKYKRVYNNRFKIVYLYDFWEWAEQNKRKIDFSKMEENILGLEPEWAKKKRKIDFECRMKGSPWTKAEDLKLERMVLRHKYTYTDLSAAFNRTEGAIRQRIYDLVIDVPPVRAKNKYWTAEETAVLVFMHDEGWSLEKIGAKLGRTGQSCRGKIELLNKPEMNLRVNRRSRQYEVN